MSKLKNYKLSFEKYCIHQEKFNKLNNKLTFICNDCGHCYINFYEMLEIAIIEEKYNKKERKKLRDYLTTIKLI